MNISTKPEDSTANPPVVESPKKSYATIGPSITIHGDVTGEEDLLINGTVEGVINLKENNLVVGEKGKVIANVVARSIRIEGEVRGEIRGSEQISIISTGKVNGDLRAPRVVLNDGCQFKGSVDMDQDKAPSASAERILPSKRASSKRLPPLPNGNIPKKVGLPI